MSAKPGHVLREKLINQSAYVIYVSFFLYVIASFLHETILHHVYSSYHIKICKLRFFFLDNIRFSDKMKKDSVGRI